MIVAGGGLACQNLLFPGKSVHFDYQKQFDAVMKGLITYLHDDDIVVLVGNCNHRHFEET